MDTNQAQQVDNLIVDHFQENPAGDDDQLIAAVSASHKLQWANSAAVGFEEVESRLEQLCEYLGEEDEHSAVPRYRLKSAGNGSP